MIEIQIIKALLYVSLKQQASIYDDRINIMGTMEKAT